MTDRVKKAAGASGRTLVKECICGAAELRGNLLFRVVQEDLRMECRYGKGQEVRLNTALQTC